MEKKRAAPWKMFVLVELGARNAILGEILIRIDLIRTATEEINKPAY